MKKKNRNRGKKVLTAVGAVVAAGLTPGIIAATPGCLPGQSTKAEITAAEVVAIDGTAYSFDELYAKQHPDSVKMDTIVLNIVLEPTNATLYGATMPVPSKNKPVPSKNKPVPSKNKRDTKAEDIVIFRSVEEMPQFPGGEAALMKFIQSHIKYPREAAKNNIQGCVDVQFVVDKTGKVGNVMIVRSVDKYLDKEAVRVVKKLPKFTPGRQNGKAVSVWYTLPVTFTLPK